MAIFNNTMTSFSVLFVNKTHFRYIKKLQKANINKNYLVHLSYFVFLLHSGLSTYIFQVTFGFQFFSLIIIKIHISDKALYVGVLRTKNFS